MSLAGASSSQRTSPSPSPLLPSREEGKEVEEPASPRSASPGYRRQLTWFPVRSILSPIWDLLPAQCPPSDLLGKAGGNGCGCAQVQGSRVDWSVGWVSRRLVGVLLCTPQKGGMAISEASSRDRAASLPESAMDSLLLPGPSGRAAAKTQDAQLPQTFR